MKKKSLLIFLLVLLCAQPVFAQKLPEPTKDFYVYDEVGVLSDEAKSSIVRTDESLYKQTGSQIVVCVLDHLPEGETVETAAVDLFDKWNIGSKDEDNGVLLLISMREKKFRIEVGYGLEGAIPDMKAQAVLDDLVPYFQEDRYEAGILHAFDELLTLVGDEYQVDITGQDALAEQIDEDSDDIGAGEVIGTIVRIIILIALISFFFGGGRGGRGRRRYRGPYIFPGGYGGFGGSSGGFGGGNFGGGGSSGGGGASGGW
ncbi:MAG: TPM domain-containing protein [Peptoniphilus sp.]|nr:TPM domain-containing protein [Peptoniphilus sp.]MDD7362702.1 TPM domain-containing protein [Bacillota bacterium]MDY6044899.1 TPM domain-containing protein [Peptoniphilus sp.]